VLITKVSGTFKMVLMVNVETNDPPRIMVNLISEFIAFNVGLNDKIIGYDNVDLVEYDGRKSMKIFDNFIKNIT
jgi:hypothetical protein